MLFNSIEFCIFLPLVLIAYWQLNHRNLKLQNFLLVTSSYFFYGWWDWRFLSLIFASTLVDFSIGIFLANQSSQQVRKLLLYTSLAVNLGILGFFKYFNFFTDNFATMFTFMGFPLSTNALNIVLPVGISFYTFQTLSYTIDVYKRKIEPSRDILAFSAFVSFFPQLVAGPIERATNLLTQFQVNRKFSYGKVVDGLRQILWGFFKKIVIADTCATFVNPVFADTASFSGSTLLLAAVFFAFQIYGDFSGYSDIAIGTSRLFGFHLQKNFAFPYFSRDIAEFWRRWHISLSTWFRDYLYIPLGGSRVTTARKILNTIIIFSVSGFWHGANWTFIIWGILNAIYLIPLLLSRKNRKNLDTVALGRTLPSIVEVTQMLSTFLLVCFAWIFFRAANLAEALQYLNRLFSLSFFSTPRFSKELKFQFVATLLIFIYIEWRGRNHQFALEKFALKWHRFYRWTFYYILMVGMLLSSGAETNFIYFQF